MTRKFSCTYSSPFGVQRKNFIIDDDNTSVLDAFKALSGDTDCLEVFSVYDENGNVLFTEDCFCDDNNEPKICRFCGKLMEFGEGVYVEMNDVCHCDDCHEKLYTKEEWDCLSESDIECSDSYYWTTVDIGWV